jgi:hypothetical protein
MQASFTHLVNTSVTFRWSFCQVCFLVMDPFEAAAMSITMEDSHNQNIADCRNVEGTADSIDDDNYDISSNNSDGNDFGLLSVSQIGGGIPAVAESV